MEGTPNKYGIKGCSCTEVECPYYEGLRLWVRETWGRFRRSGEVCFKADNPHALPQSNPWKPSIHLLRADARLFLEVTDVRVQRLCEISEDDAKAEGVDCTEFAAKALTRRQAFEDLWDSINGKKHPWESNPWVWVYTFKKL